MKMLSAILLVLSFIPTFSQVRPADYSYIDGKAISVKATGVDSLATQLIALGKTDHEKVRAIYRWITGHIAYNVKIFARNRKGTFAGIIYEEPDDTASTLSPLNERVAAKVLRRRIAVCDGYTRLFKTLCDRAGILNEIITGYARTNIDRLGSRFMSNHTWNAVYLDSNWHLLDVTWASGFISYSEEFIRHYDEYYFLTPPEHFIRDHYPEDLQWTLLADPPTFREFYYMPFRYSAYIKNGINSYYPAKGIISAKAGDTIKVELETNNIAKNLFVADTPVIDSAVAYSRPATVMGKKISYTYTVTAGAKDWLFVFYNDEVVLRYKLNIKKRQIDLPSVMNN